MPTVPEKLQISFHLFKQEPGGDRLAPVLVNGCNHFDGSARGKMPSLQFFD